MTERSIGKHEHQLVKGEGWKVEKFSRMIERKVGRKADKKVDRKADKKVDRKADRKVDRKIRWDEGRIYKERLGKIEMSK